MLLTTAPLSKEDLFRYFYEENLKPYLSFQERTTVKPQVAQLIALRLLKYIPKEKTALSILDIGCGGGEQTRALVEEVALARPETKIQLVAVDPSAKILALAHERLQELPTNVDVKIYKGGVHPLPTPRLYSLLSGKHYDFILASQIMFWIDDWLDALNQLIDCLNTGGILCIVLVSHKCGEKWAAFHQGLFKIAHQETGFPQHFFAEELEEILEEHNIEYSTDTLTSVVLDFDSTSFYEIDEKLEFLMLFPRRELTVAQREAIQKHLRTTFSSGPLESCRKLIWIHKR